MATNDSPLVVPDNALSLELGQGGTEGRLSWESSGQLSDQALITLKAGQHIFSAPSKSTWIGFGEGWLYESPDGAPLPQAISQNGESITYEFGPGSEARFVQTDNGIRVILSSLLTTPTTNYNAGFIGWDAGEEITSNDRVFMFSRVSCSSGDVPEASFQWKQERIRAYPYLSGNSNNSAYLSETTPVGSGQRIIAYPGGSGAGRSLYTQVPTHGQGWFNHAWLWRPNTPDIPDGRMAVLTAREGGIGLTVDSDMSNSSGDTANDIIQSNAPERPRYALIQDYVGNNADGTTNVIIKRTDQYWQLNGTHFFIADSADPSTAQLFWPLRVVSVPDSKTAVLKLWKGTFESYSGLSVLVYDEDLNFVDSVSL